jgi:hypothetical protein
LLYWFTNDRNSARIMALFINDTGVVPNPDGWKYYFAETNHMVITKNYSYIYPEVVKHAQANGLAIPTEQQVIDWMCQNLFVPCYERDSPCRHLLINCISDSQTFGHKVVAEDEILADCLAYKNLQYQSNLSFRITERLRHRLRMALRWSRASKLASSIDLLGCSIADFKIYIESKFEIGMSWENYGYKGWHIDHIMPCALFDLTNPDHQKQCFHFSNMQPMWATRNFKKSKSSDQQFRLL